MKAKELLDIIVPHGCLLAEDKNSGLRIIVQRPDGMPIARCYTPASAVIAAYALNVLPLAEDTIKNARAVLTGFNKDGRIFVPKADDPVWDQVPLVIAMIDEWLAKANQVEVPE